MTARLERVRAQLEEPLLVTTPTNVLTRPGSRARTRRCLARVGGIRIDEMVLVTDHDPERLTTFTKDVVVVD